jgi:hypothetical protein
VPVKVEVAGPDSGDGMTSTGLPALFTAGARPARARAGGPGRDDGPIQDDQAHVIRESSTPWTRLNYTVWIERFGSIRSEDRHEGGQWSLYLPANSKGLAVPAHLPRSRHAHG